MNSQLTLVESNHGSSTDAPRKKLKEILEGVASKELVLAFGGPIGAGLKDVIDLVGSELESLDYKIERIKISELIKTSAHKLGLSASALDGKPSKQMERYRNLQDLGSQLRLQKGGDVLAQLAVRYISLDRAKKNKDAPIGEVVPQRVVYLIDQLKNPGEVSLLRAVYRENFYLLGVLCGYEQRKMNLKTEGMSVTEAETLMEIDRKEGVAYGQNLEKTLQLADFFLRNSTSNTKAIREPIDRFLRLMHGDLSVTPTVHEQGMYAAFSAGLGSACMSRQVGAAIIDREGKLIATGCNDVPRGGGGLYREDGSAADNRCIHLKGGVCFNDQSKDVLRDSIGDIIKLGTLKYFKDDLPGHLKSGIENVLADPVAGLELISEQIAEKIAATIRTESRLKDLIEFSRAVHAEMDAIVNLGRTGQGISQDSVLYTTTYPCHNCARHIVAAGIRAVFFIEPYEKSLASDLHSDSISHDADGEPLLSEWLDVDRLKNRKVNFLHFEGVAPKRYMDLFFAEQGRKGADGRRKPWLGATSSKKIPEYLEAYPALESRVVQHLDEAGMGI